MPDAGGDRISRMESTGERPQPVILGGAERQVIRAFEFDADRKIIAALAPEPARFAGMPGAF